MRAELAIASLLALAAIAPPLRAEEATENDATTIAEPTPQPVKRALFTPGIDGREPAGESEFFYTTTDKVFFFTELRGMQGEQIKYRWFYKDQLMAEVPFAVTSQRWRSASSKQLLKEWTGEWRVDLTNTKGEVLVSKNFIYKEAP